MDLSEALTLVLEFYKTHCKDRNNEAVEALQLHLTELEVDEEEEDEDEDEDSE